MGLGRREVKVMGQERQADGSRPHYLTKEGRPWGGVRPEE